MFRSPFPDEVIPNVSVYEFLFGNLDDEDARRIALVDGHWVLDPRTRILRWHKDTAA